MAKYILFNNGIFNLNTWEFFPKNCLQAEEKQPGDCLNLNCDYVQFSKNHKDILEIQEYLKKLFPNEVVFHQFMNKYSDIIMGKLNNENHKWYGYEESGKSTLLQFFKRLFRFHNDIIFYDN